MADAKTTAYRLMTARRYAGFSRAEFARLMGRSRGWVIDHETGRGKKEEPEFTVSGERIAWMHMCGLPMEWLEVDAVEAVKNYAQAQAAARAQAESRRLAREAAERIERTDRGDQKDSHDPPGEDQAGQGS